MSVRRILAVAMLAMLAVPVGGRAAEQEKKPRISADAEVLPMLARHPLVRRMLEELPEEYRVEPEIVYRWSDDERKRIPHLVALFPISPKGKRDGKAYFLGGELRVVPYEDGRKEGIEKRYHTAYGKEDTLVAEIPWKDGKIHGIKKLYHRANGKLWMSIPYEKGKREGTAKAFDLPGRLQKVTPYKDDKQHGKAIEYYPAEGRKKKVIPFEKGKVHGDIREYYEDGTLKREMHARNGLFHGVEKQYDEHGKLVRTRYWLEDDPVTKEEYEEAVKEDKK